MGYCVFMLRPDSIYDDFPESHYQFPKPYLRRAQGAEGDWIVYLEPTKVPQSRGYFAIARVQEIVPDARRNDMFLAIIEPGSYLEFSKPVPFSDDGQPIERRLLNEHGRLSGRAQSAVRPIAADDFLRIIEAGFEDSESIIPRMDLSTGVPLVPGLSEAQELFADDHERERISVFTNKLARDKSFRRLILRSYDERCAFTGLKLINGGGRAEVEAAHIKPVSENGPDTVQNGLALSGTVHWMFDRGLISLNDDLEIRVSRQVNDVSSVRNLLNPNGYARAPTRQMDRPHPRFLAWHREHCFKS
jgi:putative restriction endonuclease